MTDDAIAAAFEPHDHQECAHRALDEAVADAYGWGDDFRAGTLTDNEILSRLVHLNQERSGAC